MWIFRFLDGCRNGGNHKDGSQHLISEELVKAETYWVSLLQRDHFFQEIESLQNHSLTPESSLLFAVHPFVNSSSLVRVGSKVRMLESHMLRDIPSSSMDDI